MKIKEWLCGLQTQIKIRKNFRWLNIFKKGTRFCGLLVFILKDFNLGIKFWVTLPCGLHYYSSYKTSYPDLCWGIKMGFFLEFVEKGLTFYNQSEIVH